MKRMINKLVLLLSVLSVLMLTPALADTLETTEIQVTDTLDEYETTPALGQDTISKMVVYLSQELDIWGNTLPADAYMQRLSDNTIIGDAVAVSYPPTDNCPTVYNPDQVNTDGDGIGDLSDFTCYPGLLSPVLIVTGRVDFTYSGREYTRYQLCVTNWDVFPDELFEAAPDLPSCGGNPEASRTWVKIYKADDTYLHGYCAISDNEELQDRITFTVPTDEIPPAVYITLWDRRCELTYKSNLAGTNLPPVADAGGPYEVNEGIEITFDASGSSDPDGDTLQYHWDFDNDGDWDIESNSPHGTYTWNDDYSGEVVLEVSDGELTDTDTTTVTVSNVAPTAIIDSVEQPIAGFILPNDVLTFIGSFTDPGTLDTHTTEWDFGDGESTAGFSVTHSYVSAGVYTVTFTVTDNDVGVGTATTTITVSSAQDAMEVIDDYIQNLPDDAFANNPDLRKTAFSNKLDEVKTKIEACDYEDAINKLQNDILPKLNGFCEEDTADLDWISDAAAQEEVYSMIEGVIAYLETLL